MLEILNPLVAVPTVPAGEKVDEAFDWLKTNFDLFFDAVGDGIESSVEGMHDILMVPDPLIVTVLLGLLAWLVRDWKLGVGTVIGFVAIQALGEMWEPAMWTLSQILLAAVIALVIGVPVGIASARSATASRVVRPVMDFLQTMPGLVWLVPMIGLFGIGNAAAIVATVIFAIAPSVRLTELGIRQVESEVVEAGQAFGATSRAILKNIQLPLAMPTVMAGVNQVIMLALSMAVIAGMVGADGLGKEVTGALAQANVAQGFDAGFAIVILAIFLDRLTASVGSRRPGHGRIKELRERFSPKPKPHEKTTAAA
ncbi:glycine betaine/proline transport system permease protein [Nocardioides albertanoniae]|uniref:Glycine betaine/proline transport system permease protein n=1 Tax=Nocardioides albertanoniae TaxID=1175486 RepID=A0A543AB95_9ACTN|nr:ABC transporter permease subunit [Nocardioides albertanoniae]TQL69884.1 glycine betaine/proline transport system permease protein [Nocardioides albertanoniae]